MPCYSGCKRAEVLREELWNGRWQFAFMRPWEPVKEVQTFRLATTFYIYLFDIHVYINKKKHNLLPLSSSVADCGFEDFRSRSYHKNGLQHSRVPLKNLWYYYWQASKRQCINSWTLLQLPLPFSTLRWYWSHYDLWVSLVTVNDLFSFLFFLHPTLCFILALYWIYWI